jgi:hypothetical protein
VLQFIGEAEKMKKYLDDYQMKPKQYEDENKGSGKK